MNYKCVFGSDYNEKEKVINVNGDSIRDVLLVCLKNGFDNDKDCLEYWNEIGGGEYKNLGEVVDKEVIGMMRNDFENDDWDGRWRISEEGWVEIYKDGKLIKNM